MVVGALVLAVAAGGLGDVTTLTGSPYALESLIGQGPVVLVFWNSWLPDGEAFVELLPEIERRVKGRGWRGALIVFQDESAAERHLGAPGELVRLLDRRGELLRRFQVTRAPAVVVIDAAGAVVGRAGPDPDEVRRLLAEGVRR